MESLKCGCGNTITKLQASVSNWMYENEQYVCPTCQGLPEYPSEIVVFASKNGQLKMGHLKITSK